jgi:subtilisin family serine protease
MVTFLQFVCILIAQPHTVFHQGRKGMKTSLLARGSWIVLLVLALFAQPGGAASFSAQQTGPAQDRPDAQLDPLALPTDQLIVRYREPAGRQTGGSPLAPAAPGQVARLSQAAGARLAYVRAMSGGAHVYRLPQAAAQAELGALVAGLRALPEIDYAEPDQRMVHTLAPNDPQYGAQWHYGAPAAGNYGINLPLAWDVTTGTNTVVAVIDTGLTNHADLSGRSVPGYDFIGDTFISNDGNGRDGDPADPGDWSAADACYSGSPAVNSSWHGTHVAGTIAANSNNGLGVAGVNWLAKVLPVRVLGRCGGFTSDIVDGMRWAAGLSVGGVPANANPARVLNLSLGGSGSCSTTYQNAVNEIVAAGKTVVVAAGNSSSNSGSFQPASCSGVITVAATNRNGSRSFYSNFGASVEISAPGGETNGSASNGVLSTLNTGTQGPLADSYAFYQGTSMAAPHVAGVVSLLYALNPALTPAQVLQALQDTATGFPGGSTCNTANCGSGIVNAAAALASLAQPQTCANLVLDPGFEAYTPNPHWDEASLNFGTPLCTLAACGTGGGTVGPRNGSAWAWFGGSTADETASLQQSLVIPDGTASLEFYLRIGEAAAGSGADDVFTASIDGITLFSANAGQIGAYGSFKKVTVDASSYANGASHTLRFAVHTSDQVVNFNLDDVALCAGGVVVDLNRIFVPIIQR